jgi:hypothetical protein
MPIHLSPEGLSGLGIWTVNGDEMAGCSNLHTRKMKDIYCPKTESAKQIL